MPKLILVRHSINQVLERFKGVVEDVLTKYTEENTHHIVMVLFVAHYAITEPFAFWRKSGLPVLVAMTVPDFTVVAVAKWD
ncbi:MAG: hypothetical protein NVS4B9_33480 [Ktedonobacteraceae bacterium]